MHQKLQSAATTGNGTAKSWGASSPRELKFYITGSSGVSGGTVQVEESQDPNYTGTWAAIGSAVTVTASTTKTVAFTGATGAVRARITSTILGGTVDVDLFTSQDYLP